METRGGAARAATLRERDLRAEGLIVAEGRHCVARLCASALDILEVLCAGPVPPEVGAALAARGRLEALRAATEADISGLAGYPFHRGCLALAKRPSPPPLAALAAGRARGVAIPDLVDAENVGGIARSVLALGYGFLAVGKSCADPLSRRAARVSMGAVYSLPLAVFRGPEELVALKAAGYLLVAASLEGRPLDEAREVLRASAAPFVLLLGNEERGLGAEYTDICDLAVGIPMARGADSLNVGVAAGILLHALA